MAVRKAYVDTEWGQMHFRVVRGDGTPLVMFHRTPASSASFESLMTLMVGERPLYAFDTPGFGQSFDPPGMPSIADYAAYMRAAFDALGLDRVHIFAHHTGTHFATELAAAYPDRVAALILNGIAYLTAEEREKFRATVAPPKKPDPEGRYAAETWTTVAGLFDEFDPDLTHAEFLGAMRAITGRDQAFNAVWDQDYPATLDRVTCPVLATCAENDMLRPFFDRVLADHPEFKSELLGPAKFFTPEYDAERTAAAIRAFLTDVESR